MREATVKRLETIANERTGYITTEELLKSGITNRQIAVFVDKGMLEKISHGHYWLACAGCGKPAEYKAVELCITNPNLIICADSACFYQGLISVEPERVSKIGFEDLAEGLADTARLRLENPDASLKELGMMLAPPVGKSGVNHRLRKLSALAEELRGNEGGELL